MNQRLLTKSSQSNRQPSQSSSSIKNGLQSSNSNNKGTTMKRLVCYLFISIPFVGFMILKYVIL